MDVLKRGSGVGYELMANLSSEELPISYHRSAVGGSACTRGGKIR